MSATSVSTESVKEDIQTVLAGTAGGDFQQTAVALLRSLGYVSERTLGGQPGNPADFIRLLSEQTPAAPGLTGTQSERAFLDHAKSVRILFQLTGSEIQAQTQPGMSNPTEFDTGNSRSFLFAAVELNGYSYTRGQYAAFTRELNKHIQLPMVVLFCTADNRITLAFVYRRPNKRDPNRDVLGSVSLIREIDPARPHRAHLDILAELSLLERLHWMDSYGKTHNFDGLLDAWLDALDTEELNRRFYRDLFGWFERGRRHGQVPHGRSPEPACRGARHPSHHPSDVRLVHQGEGAGGRRPVHREPRRPTAEGLRPGRRRFLLPRRAAKPLLRHPEYRD